jgi:hypothetical protein
MKNSLVILESHKDESLGRDVMPSCSAECRRSARPLVVVVVVQRRGSCVARQVIGRRHDVGRAEASQGDPGICTAMAHGRRGSWSPHIDEHVILTSQLILMRKFLVQPWKKWQFLLRL